MKDKLRIIVTGLIGQHHTLGGVTWDYLQYVLGLKNLGHDVYYFEDSGEWPYNLDGGVTGKKWESESCNTNIEYINTTLKKYDLGDNWAYKYPISNSWFGMSEKKRNSVLKSADLLINVSGTLEFPEYYNTVKRMAYIDSDPGFTEIKMHSKEFANRVFTHDVHFSFGELLSDRKTESGITWLPTRSPIVISEWESGTISRDAYTTIMNWTSYEPLKWAGKVYSQKDTEFNKFVDLPQRYTVNKLEVAMPKLNHQNWNSNNDTNKHMTNDPFELLTNNKWLVVDSHKVCSNMDNYRSYIENSRGEWSVAKGGYVIDKSGWFSCRSACYLAAGKPVVVQNTGFDKILPTGEGLFAFDEMDEAIDALKQIDANYKYHCKKAKEIAYDYLDAKIVLGELLNNALI
jgi:hypothetical protein